MRREVVFLLGLAMACTREKQTRETPEGRGPGVVPTSEAVLRVGTELPGHPVLSGTSVPGGSVEVPLGDLRGHCLLAPAEGRCLNHYSRYPADLKAECALQNGVYTLGRACAEGGMMGKCRDGFPGRETVYFPSNPNFKSLENVRSHCLRLGGRLLAP